MPSTGDNKPTSKRFLEVSSFSAAYAGEAVVKDISFSLAEGELACLLGPSGCGKTTILRAICGFQNPTQGAIHLNRKLLANPQTSLEPEQRNVGMVFQDHALFPHLTIAENVGFGLNSVDKSSTLNNTQKQQRIVDMLDLVSMSHQSNKYPHELSGGQSQRVALARAIAPQPTLLLLDEPFSNLDTELRESLGYEVRSLLKELGVTAIMVTHDQHDAFALGDHVGVMSEGKLLQWDTSFNLYHTPNSRFIANFIGDGVFIQGQMLEENTVRTDFGDIRGKTVSGNHIGKNVDLLIRPDDVRHDPNKAITGQISRKAFKGAQTLYTIKTNSGECLMALVPSHDDYEIGDTIGVQIYADHLVCFDRDA